MKKKNYQKICLMILLISCCLQNVVFIDFGMFGFKLYHLIGILLLPIAIKGHKIKLPPKFITIFFLYILIVSIFAGFSYGFHSLLLRYIFCYYLIIVIFNLGNNLTENDWSDILCKTAWIILILVYLRAIQNYKIILNFFKNPFGHPIYNFIFSGGANIEATWIALFVFLLKPSKKSYIYLGLSFALSTILASRVGIIANCIGLIYYIFYKKKDNSKNILKLFILIFFTICGIILLFQLDIIQGNYILQRFGNIGKDPGSIGRLSMWMYIFDCIKLNPFGFGLGNAIKGINMVSTKIITEGNVHNLFFQMLVDTGILGGIFYLLFVIYFFIKHIKNFFSNKYVAFLSVYFILGLLQFAGGDAIMFYVLGIFLTLKSDWRKNEVA